MDQILVFVLKNSAIIQFKLVTHIWERHLLLKKIYNVLLCITEDKNDFAMYRSWFLNDLSSR